MSLFSRLLLGLGFRFRHEALGHLEASEEKLVLRGEFGMVLLA
jgi:hypothetical protein